MLLHCLNVILFISFPCLATSNVMHISCSFVLFHIQNPLSCLCLMHDPCFYVAVAQIGSVCNRITLDALRHRLFLSLLKAERILLYMESQHAQNVYPLLVITIYKTELSVRLSVCLSVMF